MDDDAATSVLSVTIAAVDWVRTSPYLLFNRPSTRKSAAAIRARRCIDVNRAGYDAPRRLGTLDKRS